MISKSFEVKDKDGLHARPASLLAGMSAKYKSITDIEYKGKRYTMKSIMIIMSLGIAFGEEFSIICEGEDEKRAFDAIQNMLLEQGII